MRADKLYPPFSVPVLWDSKCGPIARFLVLAEYPAIKDNCGELVLSLYQRMIIDLTMRTTVSRLCEYFHLRAPQCEQRSYIIQVHEGFMSNNWLIHCWGFGGQIPLWKREHYGFTKVLQKWQQLFKRQMSSTRCNLDVLHQNEWSRWVSLMILSVESSLYNPVACSKKHHFLRGIDGGLLYRNLPQV